MQQLSRPLRRPALALLAGAACAVVLVPQARANPFTPQLSVASSDMQAGAHPTITATIQKNKDFTEQRLQSIALTLPRGFFAGSTGTSFCTLTQTGGNYSCEHPESQVGTAQISAQLDINPGPPIDLIDLDLTAKTYRETPATGEIARLVTIPDSLPATYQVTTIGLAPSGDSLTLEQGDLPTTVTIGGTAFDLHTYRVDTTLDGTSGSTPLTYNPTFCDPANGFAASFQSYGDDGVPSSDDQTVARSVPYTVAGCDSVPFDPRVALGLTDSTAGAPSSPTSAVEIPEGNATVASVRLSFPREFLLNPASTVTSCEAVAFAAGSCGAESKLGTVTVISPLTTDPLAADAYLGPADGSRLKVGVFAPPPLSIRFDGFLEQRADGGIDLLSNLPPIPVEEVEFSLGPGATGTFLNPFACGSYTASAALASHSGKTATIATPVVISGCQAKARGAPSLRARLSTTKAGRYTNLRVDVAQEPDRLNRVKLALPRSLEVLPRRVPQGVRKRVGYVEFWDDAQHVHRGTLALRARGGGKRARLYARNGQLGDLAIRIVRGKRRASLTMRGIPAASVTDFNLTLLGRHSHLLRNRQRQAGACDRALGFTLDVFGVADPHAVASTELRASCTRRPM